MSLTTSTRKEARRCGNRMTDESIATLVHVSCISHITVLSIFFFLMNSTDHPDTVCMKEQILLPHHLQGPCLLFVRSDYGNRSQKPRRHKRRICPIAFDDRKCVFCRVRLQVAN